MNSETKSVLIRCAAVLPLLLIFSKHLFSKNHEWLGELFAIIGCVATSWLVRLLPTELATQASPQKRYPIFSFVLFFAGVIVFRRNSWFLVVLVPASFFVLLPFVELIRGRSQINPDTNPSSSTLQ